jgi:bifunctional DNA-binding transcriptional regulator/antitoxin component of YhaV-PrlF toxin-antitoxin module
MKSKVGYPTRIQRVDRPTNQSFYAIIPVPLAQAFGIDKGEEFEWIIEDRNVLVLKRAKSQKSRTKTGKN